MASKKASKLLAAIEGTDEEKASGNRRKLVAGVRSALESDDDDKLGEALDAYVSDFMDETE